ncbi:hypothetical protein PG997_006439 [Apiospora hydei]|uniref:Fe2OG dioxygenase domain-containing protein n=1 Tax=Apiospora hydei TaxID=1337664 RepID=A0ABR1WNT3_9PEZI
MLNLDPALFPKLTTRKALVIVDAQNDFLSPDGALPVTLPHNLTAHILDLVKAFRPYGDIIWVRSVYEESRDPEDESISTSDAPMIGGRRAVARGRRPQANPHDQPSSECPEAFLTAGGQNRPACVRRGTSGAELPGALKEILEKKDLSFVKSHYSAFRSEELLQRLRMKFVTEIFVCGTMTNIGIQASAMDAASHGLDITIVEDCCGRRSSMRHANALKQIVKTTGCEVISAEEVVEKLKPKEKKESKETLRIPRTPAPAPASELSSFANASIDDVLPAEKSEAHSSPPRGPSAAASRLSPGAKAEKKLKTIGADEPEMRGKTRPQAARSRTSEMTLEDAMSSLTMGSAKSTNGFKTGKARNKDQKSSKRAPPRTEDKTEGVEDESKTSPTDTGTQSSSHAMKDFPNQGNPAVEETAAEKRLHHNTESSVSDHNTESSVSDPYGERDTRIHYNVLPDDLVAGIFDKLRDEVQWLRMSHQGGEVPRLVAVQGEVGKEGDIPIYRHPADESPPLLPWTSTVKQIKDVVEKKVGHPLNHALIQLYRGGNDYISEHSDKTLDIAKDSYIVNVSLGAERQMVFRTKRPPKEAKETTTVTDESKGPPEPTVANGGSGGTKRTKQSAQLPHNSMCQMGLQTNMRWLHAIRQDKRLDREKTPAELAFGGARISLTFRKIGTFLDREGAHIWGQGATGKGREEAHKVANGAGPEAVRMIQAFGRENQSSEFDWEAHYGAGFDVLNLSTSPRLFTSSDGVANWRVQVMLAEYGVGYAKGSLAPVSAVKDNGVGMMKEADGDEEEVGDDKEIKLVDNDEAKSTVQGDLAIMLYMTQRQGCGNPGPAVFTRFQKALDLLPKIRRVRSGSSGAALQKHLQVWETYAAESEFIAAPSMTLADFAFWPVLHEVKQRGGADPLAGFIKLEAYYQRVKERESVQKALGGAGLAGSEKGNLDGDKVRLASRFGSCLGI